MRADFLIVGQGLAGTALAWQLAARGRSFLIVDRDEPLTSSKVAAGLVTPVTGMRLSLNWRFGELHPEALAFYRDKEERLGRRFFFEAPHVRLFKKPEEIALWQKRSLDAALMRHVNPAPQDPLVDDAVFANPLGGFEQKDSGYLETAAYLSASRAHFEGIGAWERGEFRTEEARAGADGIVWKDRRFAALVLCQGWEAARGAWFDWAPFQSALGTVLGVSAEIRETRIINRGCWLLPRHEGGFLAGPTYELKFADPHTPSESAVSGLAERLRSLLRAPFAITGAQTAVRPIVRGCRALIGKHPSLPGVAFFNGLGSKGVLRAPFMARRLVEHLLDGAPLEPEYDLQRNL